MRAVTLNSIGTVRDQAVVAALREIQNASQEYDLVSIFAPYSITGSFTETRNLNVTSPTTANLAAVLATIIVDFQRGGQFRTT